MKRLTVSQYTTEDGNQFMNRDEAKEHSYWLHLVELCGSLPIQASTESGPEINRQRADWMKIHAKEIARLCKYAKDRTPENGASEPEPPKSEPSRGFPS